MFLVKDKASLDNRAGRFAFAIFLVVAVYFALGIVWDISTFLGR